MTEKIKAYIAGFLDGDGSVYVRIKPHEGYKYKFQISPYIVFYQAKKNRLILEYLKDKMQVGYIRDRNDGICEYIIGDLNSIEKFIKWIGPYSILKRKQIQLMSKILQKKRNVKSVDSFLELCRFIDKFKELNYSKKRKNTENQVRKVLKQRNLLTP